MIFFHKSDLGTSYVIPDIWWDFKKDLSKGCSAKEALKLIKIIFKEIKLRKNNCRNNSTDKRNGLGKIYKSINIFEGFPPRRKNSKIQRDRVICN